MATHAKKSLWLLALPLLLTLVVALALMRPNGLAPDVYTLTRLAALLGYQLIFWAVLSSAFTRPLIKAFGRPFVKLHHIVALSGLALIAVHPVLAVISWGDRTLFFPRLDSFANFIQWGGSPAFDLLLLAVLAAAFRKRLKSAWQIVHALTYLAFLLGTAHATTAAFTTDLQGVAVRVVFWLLALAAVAIFVLRRTLLRPRRPAAR